MSIVVPVGSAFVPTREGTGTAKVIEEQIAIQETRTVRNVTTNEVTPVNVVRSDGLVVPGTQVRRVTTPTRVRERRPVVVRRTRTVPVRYRTSVGVVPVATSPYPAAVYRQPLVQSAPARAVTYPALAASPVSAQLPPAQPSLAVAQSPAGGQFVRSGVANPRGRVASPPGTTRAAVLASSPVVSSRPTALVSSPVVQQPVPTTFAQPAAATFVAQPTTPIAGTVPLAVGSPVVTTGPLPSNRSPASLPSSPPSVSNTFVFQSQSPPTNYARSSTPPQPVTSFEEVVVSEEIESGPRCPDKKPKCPCSR